MILNDYLKISMFIITDMPPNYQNGKVYKLVSDDTDEEYVGSTTIPLFKRFYDHKKNSKVRHSRLYLKMAEIGVDNWRIILLENYPCNSKDELYSREEYYRKKLNAKLNMKMCCTPTKEEIADTRAKYYEENKEKILTIQARYREENKEKILATKAKYREENKEKIAATYAKYYEENKEKILAREAKLITCECGREISNGVKSRHMKSKIHKRLMDEKIKDDESYPLTEINFIDE